MMKKLILPILIVVALIMVWMVYFAPSSSLGSFSVFDTNNNANKEIRVKFAPDPAFAQNTAGGTATFYVIDKNNTRVKVEAPLPLPEGFRDANTLLLLGHLHADYFHAASITVE